MYLIVIVIQGQMALTILIDREDTIYQTVSVYKITWHVGLMRSKCVVTKKCEPSELKK